MKIFTVSFFIKKTKNDHFCEFIFDDSARKNLYLTHQYTLFKEHTDGKIEIKNIKYVFVVK